MTLDNLHRTIEELSPGQNFHGYRLLEQIGFGGQGVVWSALDPARKSIFAIKFNPLPEPEDGNDSDNQDHEQLVKLQNLKQDHILPLIEFGFEARLRYLMSPYAPGGTLGKLIRTQALPIADCLRIGLEIASAIDYLHERGIIHRDIKSSNILLDLNRHTFLADFGLARLLSTATLALHTGHATPLYAPPEQLQLKPITPRSDIFSFGILLFEIFAGQLPWSGKRQLGMEQTHTDTILPDVRERRDEIPSSVTDVLRIATSVEPRDRPHSAGELMQMLCGSFDVTPTELTGPEENIPGITPDRNVNILLTTGLEEWSRSGADYLTGLTNFALIDLQREHIPIDEYGAFVLGQSIIFGFNDQYWWEKTRELSTREKELSALIQEDIDAVTARIVQHLLREQNIISDDLSVLLLKHAVKSDDLLFRRHVLACVKTLAPRSSDWNENIQPDETSTKLGELALEDSADGDLAAELIGHIRSVHAVDKIAKYRNKFRRLEALTIIQRVAGSLPTVVNRNIRFRLGVEEAAGQLTHQPGRILAAYLAALTGAALGIGAHVYLTYNLPDFLDTARITASLVQGLIVGSVLSAGILSSRLIVERLERRSAFSRLLWGVASGGSLITLAIILFHILFLNTPPMGLNILSGCMLIALGFSVSSFQKNPFLRPVIATLFTFTAFAASWWVHVQFAETPLDLSPLLRYDYTWPSTRIILTLLEISAVIGLLGAAVDLNERESE